jgi:hypothetical protein
MKLQTKYEIPPNRLNPSKNSRELEKNHKTLPLTITHKIIDKLSPSKSFREFKKIIGFCH